MIFYVGVTAAAIALALPVRANSIRGSKQDVLNRLSFATIFILLFAVSAGRTATGIDYWRYKLNFEIIGDNRFGAVAYEIGFNAVVKVFQFLFGKGTYLTIFAFFSFVTVLFYVKALKDQADWAAFSLALLFFNGYYFSSLNTVRYYMAFAIALWSLKFVIEKKNMEFICAVLLGAMFHKTVLIVIPIYLFARLRFKLWHWCLMAVAASSAFYLKGVYRWLLFKVYPGYNGSIFDDAAISYMNILKSGAVVVFALLFYRKIVKDDDRLRIYFNLNMFALMYYITCSFIPEYTRIGYYMSACHIFLLPAILKRIEKRWLKIVFAIPILVCFGVYFYFFLRDCYGPNIKLLPYYSWLFLEA